MFVKFISVRFVLSSFKINSSAICDLLKKEIILRCWIDIGDKKFFGPGRAELLELIGEEGSISKAAKKMGMSYKKAWDMVERMNTTGSKPYLTVHKGGKKGGGAELTPIGKKVLAAYRKLTARIDKVVEGDKELLKLI